MPRCRRPITQAKKGSFGEEFQVSGNSKGINPFYIILVVTGILFTVTAIGFGIVVVRNVRQLSTIGDPHAGSSLLAWLDAHGVFVMIVQLVILALSTVAAITTDDFWTRRAEKRNKTI